MAFCLGMTSAQEASSDLSPGNRWPRETGTEQGIAGVELRGALLGRGHVPSRDGGETFVLFPNCEKAQEAEPQGCQELAPRGF